MSRNERVAGHAREPAPLESLVREFQMDVVRLCHRLLASEDEARDASQETFLRARKAFATYDPAQPFRPWLLTIASRHCVDRLRRRGVEARIFERRLLEVEDLPGSAPSPLSGLLRAEEKQRVLQAIEALPDPHRAALVLRFFADLDYDRIGELLGLARPQVASLLFRARRRLREQLRSWEEESQ